MAQLRGSKILPSKSLFRIPTPENSGPSLVRLGNDLIKQVLSMYLSPDGHPNQSVHYRIQLVARSSVIRIVEQLESLNRWIQSLAIEETEPDSVPFVFYGVTRTLEQREL